MNENLLEQLVRIEHKVDELINYLKKLDDRFVTSPLDAGNFCPVCEKAVKLNITTDGVTRSCGCKTGKTTFKFVPSEGEK